MNRAIGATVLATALASPSFAEQGQSHFTVGVVVPARVTLDVIEQPASITLTAEDIGRGYKDVSARYRVRHNDRRGYTVRIALRIDVAERVELRGPVESLELTDGMAEFQRPGDPFAQDLELELRFVLDASSTPGTFELPLEVSATPV